MAFFIPVTASTFAIPHRSQVVANFFGHTSPETHPFPQPMELRSSMSEEEWHSRTVAIWNHFTRYTWSKLLRGYLVFALILSLIGPIAANLMIHKVVYDGAEPLTGNPSDEEIRQRIALIRRGHLINFIVILFLFIFIWTPYLSYKSMGRKRLAALLISFNQTDAAKGNMQALNWTCSRTSTFQSNATVVIELPIAYISSNQPSLFHQAAYLPEYIRKEPASQGPPLYATAQNPTGFPGAPPAGNSDHKA
ncbi:hypothetical protein MJO28_013637 [Puccinia striiformis f. sp. tritici]|uniref:Uncharacterized protein n=1 Tax=Puccinia striiformis f. sp. tritici TaxID=168172 RepID=A0ACC0DW68_9BASI|nr:hypothetical protein MJO28_013637 [Puccinia striiformis f. sp. tritici]